MRKRILFWCLVVFASSSCQQKKESNLKMEQRLSIITIGCDSLQAMRKFYVEKFGWSPVAENKDIIFFKLNGFLFGLFGRNELAQFTNTTPEGSGFRPFTMAYMVDSDEKVEELYSEMKNKGVKIIQVPKVPPFGGLYFIMADVEGNVWEVSKNPFMPLDEKGNVVTHKPIDNIK